MEERSIELFERQKFGSSSAAGYRSKGRIPCVVYGGGLESNLVGLVNNKDFIKAAEKSLPTQVFLTTSETTALNNRRLIVRDIQQDAVRKLILHVDFQLLEGDRRVKLKVPLVVTGEPVGVKMQGGVLTVQARDITVRAQATKIPQQLTVDVSSLELGQRHTAAEIELPSGVELCDDPGKTVVNVIASRSSKLDEAAEATAADAATPEVAAAASAAPAKK